MKINSSFRLLIFAMLVNIANKLADILFQDTVTIGVT